MPGWLSPWELLILILVVLLVFGPKRLPEMGRGLGKGMREFKDSITGKDERPGIERESTSARSRAASSASSAEQPADRPAGAPRDRDSVA